MEPDYTQGQYNMDEVVTPPGPAPQHVRLWRKICQLGNARTAKIGSQECFLYASLRLETSLLGQLRAARTDSYPSKRITNFHYLYDLRFE